MIQAAALLTVDAQFRPLLLEGGAQTVHAARTEWTKSGLTARVVRGRRMRTIQTLFDEFAAALQFPLYFGENLDAFDECIADLECLPFGTGYVVLVTEPDEVLVDAGEEVLGWLVDSLQHAASVWASPVELGEWWDRPGVPFHVVLAGPSASIKRAIVRWSSAGATPADPWS